jgi:putative DNA primase/helicase
MSSPAEQFRAAIHNAGITPPKSIIPDGKLHRFASNGKPSDDAGWYVFYGDGIRAGAFGDWRSGLSENWRADIGRELTPREETAHRARVESMRREREAEDAKRKAEAREKAAAIWQAARPAPDDHPYLAKKGIEPHGLRVHEGRLVVPMLDDQGTLHSLHYIAADGSKWFLTGGRVAGCFYQIGETRGVICVGEGFATMATVHDATEYVAGYIACPSMREQEQRGHRDRCHSNFFHPFLRSATIAARTASNGDTIGGICSTAKNRRLVLPSIGDDHA